ncbi:hypothetical protein M569_12200 [Genlisea aurea]|uniref:Uncharacterized protein n=1 Tax=Genlisea aurea TaxID=192259 RepID=S8C724_9LAMI|nr:hypothetical protein M569_12200 [Genlisea aurea]
MKERGSSHGHRMGGTRLPRPQPRIHMALSEGGGVLVSFCVEFSSDVRNLEQVETT